MARPRVFYSFHYDNDVMRVQQVRNMGVIEGEEPVTANAWEQVKRAGNAAIEKWIDEHISRAECVVVLIRRETASRQWVRHEIVTAWNKGKGLLGIHIHNLECPNNGYCQMGDNPFAAIPVNGNQTLADHVKVHDPWSLFTYSDISSNLEEWVRDAVAKGKTRFKK